jgi:hypothetical protein
VPRKIFVAGEILTAADLQANAVDQSVMVFDDAAARTAAIPSPTEGMVTYLKDTDALEKFTTVFEPIAPPLTTANFPAGTILQVVQTTKTGTFSASVLTGATVDVDGLSASITPRATSSDILVLFDVSSDQAVVGHSLILKRNGTAISVGDAEGSRTQVTSGGNTARGQGINVSSAMVLDSPNSSSAQTYQITLLNNRAATDTLSVNKDNVDGTSANTARAASRITLMEVAG